MPRLPSRCTQTQSRQHATCSQFSKHERCDQDVGVVRGRQEKAPGEYPSPSIWWRWREYAGRSWPSPFGPFALRMFASASCLRSRTLRVRLPLNSCSNTTQKGRLAAALLRCIGGGGGSRTRVRRRLTPSTTCLAHCSISSPGSTACETHRLTSLKSFALHPSDGEIRLSHDNDGTSTSMSTSGFPAYALSGECVVVVVGN